MTLRQIMVDAFLWLGVALTLIGCLGVVLMRTVYDRLHFSSPPVLGGVCVAIAVVIQKSFSLVGDKSILIAVLLIVLSPLLTHATGRAGRLAEHGEWRVADEEVEEP
jgi:monovalent cation/proton antiporter MnhG/PhaG subunit